MRRLVLLALFASAAMPVVAEVAYKDVAASSPISVAGRDRVPVVAVTRVSHTIADQEKMGELRRGWFCSSAGNFRWDAKVAEAVAQQIKAVAAKELEAAGYRIQKKSDSAFDVDSGNQKADYEIGAVVKAIALNVCLGTNGVSGSNYFEIKWELLNAKTQKVVMSMTTQGSFKRDASEKESIAEFMTHAIAASMRNLLASKEFVATLMQTEGTVQSAAASATYEFVGAQPQPGGTEKNSTQIRAAVVTIETAAGSGSGFYIDREGYLLTCQHVIGEAKFVKVRTATGREIPGEVLRSDVRRDVALIKTASTPFEPLAMRPGETHVGEDVYSVGSPLGDTFNGSVTKGVLSGDRDLENLRFLQSDVAVLPGSSGGPLLDATGSVIGITAKALDSGRANLNLFVPIGEALNAVSVKLH